MTSQLQVQETLRVSVDQWEALVRLDKDLKSASRLMGRNSVRYLTDFYYQVQDFRKTSANQIRAAAGLVPVTDVGELENGQAVGPEPDRVLQWVFTSMKYLEEDIKRALKEYVKEYKIGNWLMSICGIGPVISAGLLSHLDIRRCKTYGHFWRFAGLDPTVEWIGTEGAKKVVEEVMGKDKEMTEDYLLAVATKINRHVENIRKLAANPETGKITRQSLTSAIAKRPWNAKLKVLCWKAGDCFVKNQNSKEDFYGKIYVARKAIEVERNEAGLFAEQAANILMKKKIGKDTEAYKAYIQGKLPPGHIHARAQRYAEKLFLSHVFYAMYLDYYEKTPPVPYPFEHLPGDHRHLILPPNWPNQEGGKSMKQMFQGG